MNNILTLNAISEHIFDVLKNDYTVGDKIANPDGILVRSFDMHEYKMPETCIAVARAGAGVNNIPTEEYAEKGIVVFNTPGANANAVNELVIASLLLGSRKIVSAIDWVKSIKEDENLSKTVEKGKKQFIGGELSGKKLGVIGLGAIGCRVSNTALGLNMEVLGYDPFMSVNSALHLSRHVEVTKDIEEIYRTCDYITIHVPFTESNKYMINEKTISMMKNGVVLINCARGELVDNTAILSATKSHKVARYITDFPSKELIGEENIICIPHLGASTPEAEDNCAIMAASELKDYFENGNIINSVNYPNCQANKISKTRICIMHKNQQNMIAQFTTILAEKKINIDNFLNSSKGNYAYSMIDIPEIDDDTLEILSKVDGVIRIRKI